MPKWHSGYGVRRKICILIGCMLIILCGSAYAAATISPKNDGIELITDGDYMLPVSVLFTNESEQMIGISQGTFNESGRCSFMFDYPKNVGLYKFYVNSPRYDKALELSYYLLDEDEKLNLFNKFKETDNLESFYTENSAKLSIDISTESEYIKIKNKSGIFEYIKERKTSVSEFNAISEIFNEAVTYIADVEHEEELDKEAIDKLNSARPEDKKAVIEENNGRFKFDLEYVYGYKRLSDSKYSKEFLRAVGRLSDLPYDMEKVRNKFDAAMALEGFNISAVQEADYIIKHYSEIFSELSGYLSLHDTDRHAVLSKALKQVPYSDIDSLIKKLKEETAAVKNNSNSNTSSGGSTGGSSGGGSAGAGAVNIAKDKNTTAGIEKRTHEFNDIKGFSWAAEAVDKLYGMGIIDGVSKYSFEPESSVTREQFVKMLIGVLGIEHSSGEGVFTDVPAGQWYSEYISAAKREGILSGYSDGSFGLGENISREDMAVMIYRALKLKNIKIVENAAADFADKNSVSEYAREAVDELSGSGIINGFEDNTFRPQDNAQRIQAVKMLYEVYKISGGAL